MSILIKGAMMPKDCPMCPLSHWNKLDEFTGCEVVNGKRFAITIDKDYAQSSTRPSWCPLVEIPPHGRLIDASEMAIKINCLDLDITTIKNLHELLMEIPTVIESEEQI